MGILSYSIDDPELLIDYSKKPSDWDYYDIDDAEAKRLKSLEKHLNFFLEEDELDEKLEEFKKGLKRYNLNADFHSIKIKDVEESDWAENWKEHFNIMKIGQEMLIKPTFLEYNGDRKYIVEIDPGMAFGTGNHETTALTLEAMEKYLKPKNNVYDIGTGSGILSIMAKKLGANKVIGVDLDERAIEAARENIILNNEEDIIIEHGDLLDRFKEPVDIIVANILANAIIELTKDIKPFLKENGYFISSGILVEKREHVVNALLNEGFNIVEENIKGDWMAIIAEVENG